MSSSAERPASPDGEELLTVDELASASGLTVRTTRYYAGLGLLPPATRIGRMAYYSSVHRARLELIRSLQEHGFTLSAIERYLTKLPDEAGVEDLTIHRVMLTAWSPGPRELLTRRQLEQRVGGAVGDTLLETLQQVSAIRLEGERWEVLPGFETVTKLMRLDLPLESLLEADEAISRHMESLADELTTVLRNRVIAPFRESRHTEQETAEFEQKFLELRKLTMEAVVTGFQRAANQVIERSLSRATAESASTEP